MEIKITSARVYCGRNSYANYWRDAHRSEVKLCFKHRWTIWSPPPLGISEILSEKVTHAEIHCRVCRAEIDITFAAHRFRLTKEITNQLDGLLLLRITE